MVQNRRMVVGIFFPMMQIDIPVVAEFSCYDANQKGL
jgi:hypothetical protein